MSCLACRDSGHRPDAPWLLCPEPGCERAAWVRQRSGSTRAPAAPPILPPLIVDPAVPPGEVHLRSGGHVVRLLGVEP